MRCIEMSDIIGIILAGGQGTRLEPLTHHRSKPAVPFGSRYRIVDFPITNCINSGIDKIFVLTQFHSASLNQHITQTYKFDIFHDSFVDIIASEASKDLSNSGFSQGTADAVRKGMDHIKSIRNTSYGLILAGDQLYRMNFRKIRHNHIENNADITLGVVAVHRHLANHFGIVKVNDQFQIVDFWEKPGDSQLSEDWYIPETIRGMYHFSEDMVFVSMSMYLIKLSLLEHILDENDSMMDFGKEIIPKIIHQYKTKITIHNGYWEDIGTIPSFHKANLDLITGKGFNIYDPLWNNLSKPSLLPPSAFQDCKISESIVGDGSYLNHCSISRSVIGQRTIIGDNTLIENSVIMGSDWKETEEEKLLNRAQNIPDIGIGKNCTIKNTIIDKNARIGNNVTLTNEKQVETIFSENYVIRNKILIICAKAIIPDNFVL